MQLELVDLGLTNQDNVGFGGYHDMVMGYGENFLDSVSDCVSLLSDLTNAPASDIMNEVRGKYPDKFLEILGPTGTIDSAPRGVFYVTALRFTC